MNSSVHRTLVYRNINISPVLLSDSDFARCHVAVNMTLFSLATLESFLLLLFSCIKPTKHIIMLTLVRVTHFSLRLNCNLFSMGEIPGDALKWYKMILYSRSYSLRFSLFVNMGNTSSSFLKACSTISELPYLLSSISQKRTMPFTG